MKKILVSVFFAGALALTSSSPAHACGGLLVKDSAKQQNEKDPGKKSKPAPQKKAAKNDEPCTFNMLKLSDKKPATAKNPPKPPVKIAPKKPVHAKLQLTKEQIKELFPILDQVSTIQSHHDWVAKQQLYKIPPKGAYISEIFHEYPGEYASKVAGVDRKKLEEYMRRGGTSKDFRDEIREILTRLGLGN